MQYQLSQTTVVKLAYAGSGSHHLQSNIGSNTLNSILPATSNAQTNSFFPSFTRGGPFITPSASRNYNGLQLDVTRRWQHDLTVDANYTYSKCLGNARDILDNDIGGNRAPYVAGVGIGADYALCDVDVRHIFPASGTYALPFGHSQAFLTYGIGSIISGGWSLQGIATVQEGQPFTVGSITTTRAGLGCNALRFAGQSPYSGAHNATQLLNPAAFANPASTATGIAALGGSPTQVTGPAHRKLDASLFWQIALLEGGDSDCEPRPLTSQTRPTFPLPEA